MWGFDRSEESELVPYKTLDEHFELFCMVMERGFAIHMGHADRLLVDFSLTDTDSHRHLPRIQTKGKLSFRLPEDWLKPSDLYLHYNPSCEDDIPRLAYFRPEFTDFIPFELEEFDDFTNIYNSVRLPVAKLSTMRGLHYIKDTVCLQLFEFDFERLFKADPVLANYLREVLTEKIKNFIDFCHPWLKASHSEQVARDYLDQLTPGSPTKKQPTSPSSDSDCPFLTWD